MYDKFFSSEKRKKCYILLQGAGDPESYMDLDTEFLKDIEMDVEILKDQEVVKTEMIGGISSKVAQYIIFEDGRSYIDYIQDSICKPLEIEHVEEGIDDKSRCKDVRKSSISTIVTN